MTHKRKAVAMIELIFAIVVMGFAMLAIPNITAQAAKSGESAINQESVAAAAAQMQNILSLYWDEEDASIDGSPILSTDTEVASVANRPGAVGRPIADIHGVIRIATSTDEGSNDMDDFDGTATTISLFNYEEQSSSKGDIIDKDMILTSTVNYSTDPVLANDYTFNPVAVSAGTTNIKRVTVTLTSTNTDSEMMINKNIVLHGFSCNIGAPTLNEVQPVL
jgi:competence protein ComGC